MNEFQINEHMESLSRLNETNPDAVTPLQRMSLGYYLDDKNAAARTESPEERKARTIELAALKARSETAALTPTERMSLGYNINELERKN